MWRKRPRILWEDGKEGAMLFGWGWRTFWDCCASANRVSRPAVSSSSVEKAQVMRTDLKLGRGKLNCHWHHSSKAWPLDLDWTVGCSDFEERQHIQQNEQKFRKEAWSQKLKAR